MLHFYTGCQLQLFWSQLNSYYSPTAVELERAGLIFEMPNVSMHSSHSKTISSVKDTLFIPKFEELFQSQLFMLSIVLK